MTKADDGGGGSGGFEVDYGLLAEAAKGINGLISELSKLGIDETAQEGRGFSLLDLDSEGLGVQGLADAFSGFTGRWSWGVRTLVQDGNQFAARMGLAAGVYYNTEQYLSGVAKVTVNALAGDPHLSPQQVQGESYGQIFAPDSNPQFGLTKQDMQQIGQTNAGELQDIKNGPWWLAAARTAMQHSSRGTGSGHGG